MARKAKEVDTAALKEANLAIKAMKSNIEVENFYRFIHENGLRSEAYKLMSLVVKTPKKPKRKATKSAKKLQ